MMIVIIKFFSISGVPDIVLRVLHILTHGVIIMPVSQKKKLMQRTEHLIQGHGPLKWLQLGSKSRPSDSSCQVFHKHARCLVTLYPVTWWCLGLSQ